MRVTPFAATNFSGVDFRRSGAYRSLGYFKNFDAIPRQLPNTRYQYFETTRRSVDRVRSYSAGDVTARFIVKQIVTAAVPVADVMGKLPAEGSTDFSRV